MKNKQLMFDSSFDKLIDENILYWKTIDDVPITIKEFINKSTDLNIIYSYVTKKYYCSKCFNELSTNYYCNNCSKKYEILKDSKNVIVVIKDNLKDIKGTFNYYAFDTIEDDVYLYIFKVDVNYNTPLSLIQNKIVRIEIEDIYSISLEGITSIIKNKFYSFNSYDEWFNYNELDLFDVFETASNKNFLYVDNLDLLKNTSLYKYTNIWSLKEYLTKEKFSVSTLTYYPIHFKEFEYLIKMGFYRLACESCSEIKYNNTFEKTFGVDKKYFQFMKDINISFSQLEGMQVCPTTDIKLLDLIIDDPSIFKELSFYSDLEKIIEYLKSQNLDYDNIYEYYDYIHCCRYMGLNMKDNKVLFPDNFYLEHNRLTQQMLITKDAEIDKKIQNLSKVLGLNIYEDEEYIIFPADSINSLIDESTQMSNCVRIYCERIANNECQIYFMRKKENPFKSFITIEVRGNKVVQARKKFNELPDKKEKEVINNWEKSIVSIFDSE